MQFTVFSKVNLTDFLARLKILSYFVAKLNPIFPLNKVILDKAARATI